MPFVTVMVKYNGIIIYGAQTDFEGQYRIELKEVNDSMIVNTSFIGYKDYECDINYLNEIIVLEEQATLGMGFLVVPPEPFDPPGTTTYKREQIRRSPRRD